MYSPSFYREDRDELILPPSNRTEILKRARKILGEIPQPKPSAEDWAPGTEN
jgi:hypothetical protein